MEELIFHFEDGKWVADVDLSSNFIVQLVYAENTYGQIQIMRSLDGEHYTLDQFSDLDNAPMIQYENYMENNYYKILTDKQPISGNIHFINKE